MPEFSSHARRRSPGVGPIEISSTVREALTVPWRIVLGLFIHAGDGPARFELEWLTAIGPRDGEKGLGPGVQAVILAVLNRAVAAFPDVSCAWRWRVANELTEAWRTMLGEPAPRLEIQHTHGAPVAYDGAGHDVGARRHYSRPYHPLLARAKRDEERKDVAWTARPGRVRAYFREIRRIKQLQRRRPAMVVRKALKAYDRDPLRRAFYEQRGEYERRNVSAAALIDAAVPHFFRPEYPDTYGAIAQQQLGEYEADAKACGRVPEPKP